MAYSTASDVRTRIGLQTTDIDDTTLTTLIAEADAEIELLTGQTWTSGNAVVERYGPFPNTEFGTGVSTLILDNYPVQTLTYIKTLNNDGTVDQTLTSSDYWIDTKRGIITFKQMSLPTWNEAVEVSYTYGRSSVPVPVRMLSECIAGVKAWIRFMSGKYNKITSYSIPEQTINKGDLYDRGLKMIEQLRTEADLLMGRLGVRANTEMASGGWANTSPSIGGPGEGR